MQAFSDRRINGVQAGYSDDQLESARSPLRALLSPTSDQYGQQSSCR
jgi:hypothetical protein